jgi:hypothetical protein
MANGKENLYLTKDKNLGLLFTTFSGTLQYGWVKAR